MELFILLGSLLMTSLLHNFLLVSLMTLFLTLSLNYPIWGYTLNESVFNLLETSISHNLVTLSVWITIFMILASSSAQVKSLAYNQLFIWMLFILLISFKVSSLILFYYWFEVALLPIFLMIMGWGYQPERLLASINLFLYTVFASLPLMISFLIISFSLYSPSFLDLSKMTTSALNSWLSFTFTLGLLAGFMVKYPLFSVHLWLPKAHVEAPVAGSMILAAILLKLGGYGFLRVTPLLGSFLKMSSSLMSFSLIGGALVSILCLRQTDMKTLIAYSSVAHMSLVIAASLSFSSTGMMGAYLLMVAHGVTSSGMFSAANVIYERWKTRSILLSKSISNIIPVFSLWWFLLCVCNMGAPPSLNLISEILSVMAILNSSKTFIFTLSFITGLAVAYTLILYASSQQGQKSFSKTTFSLLTLRETSLMALHAMFAFILSLSMNLMI